MGVNDCNFADPTAVEVCERKITSHPFNLPPLRLDNSNVPYSTGPQKYNYHLHTPSTGELAREHDDSASSILASMKHTGMCTLPSNASSPDSSPSSSPYQSPSPSPSSSPASSPPSSPPASPTLPPSILLSMKKDKSYTPNVSPFSSPPSSPPTSPLPPTSVLMSMRNNKSSRSVLCSSTSSSNSSISPAPSPHHSPSSPSCFVPHCLVCSRGAPETVLKTPTWSSIMRVVFFTLQSGFPEKEFFNLRTDVYVFMANHWDKLCPSKDVHHNWKKQIQDMLSHSKNMFESGTGFYKQNGFWRLKKPLLDPWSVNKQAFHHHHRHPARPRGMTITHNHQHNNNHHLHNHCPGVARQLIQQQHVGTTSKRPRVFTKSIQVPPLTENSSLVETFRSLQTEVTSLRESMQSMVNDLKRENLNERYVYANGQLAQEFGGTRMKMDISDLRIV